jgi:hypothetical protein
MARALVIKELRENWAIAVGATLLYVWMVQSLCQPGFHGIPFLFIVSTGQRGVPFVDYDFSIPFAFTTGLLALVLGFRQSISETVQGTYLFLLHRPWSRSAIVLTKLAVGVGILLVCSAWPIVAYGAWAATPGHVPAPFEWSMTGIAWRQLAVMPLMYLGAFLSALRPARWLGTRLVPLAASGTAMWLFYLCPSRWGFEWMFLVVVDALFAVTICYMVRTRDYS